MLQAPSSLTHTITQSAEPHTSMGWQMDVTDLPGEEIQFMRQLESIGWNGGENYFPGETILAFLNRRSLV